MAYQKLPIGLDDFAKLRSNDFYYVDKTGLIVDLLSNWGEANLFTRPRRFGKSLNMSMLRYFFEIGTDKNLFDGLKVTEHTQLCEEYMGQFPVISLSLKGVEGSNFALARANLCTVIGNEAMRFQFLLNDDSNLTEYDKDQYRQLIHVGKAGEDPFVMTDSALTGSLKTLSDLLYKHYDKQVVLLIDEYDVPLAKASISGYYGQMIDLIRGMFHASLKSNGSLRFAVLTGCLRVSKESIFTGLNNLKMYTLLDQRCDEYFGFTDEEVRNMLSAYGLSGYYDITKEWYDGYQVAGANVYNPWDVLNWCDQLLTSSNKTPKSYWSNSSGNAELRRFIQHMGNGVTQSQIERLINGQTVQKRIEEQLTYDTMYDSIENMWSLLFTTGYLTPGEKPSGNLVRLKIPNAEVRSIFSEMILKLFEEEVSKDGEAVNAFCQALKNGDADAVEQQFTTFMEKTISIRDTAVKKEFKESFYHGILLGILMFKNDWSVESNRESGDGGLTPMVSDFRGSRQMDAQVYPLGSLRREYFDIAIEIENESIGIIIEVKYAENENFDAACAEALQQIDEHDYIAVLREDEMQTILKYGIACYKKKCRAIMRRE